MAYFASSHFASYHFESDYFRGSVLEPTPTSGSSRFIRVFLQPKRRAIPRKDPEPVLVPVDPTQVIPEIVQAPESRTLEVIPKTVKLPPLPPRETWRPIPANSRIVFVDEATHLLSLPENRGLVLNQRDHFIEVPVSRAIQANLRAFSLDRPGLFASERAFSPLDSRLLKAKKRKLESDEVVLPPPPYDFTTEGVREAVQEHILRSKGKGKKDRRQRIVDAILEGLVERRGIPKIAERIAQIEDLVYEAEDPGLEGEARAAVMAALLQAMEEAGIEHIEWQTSGDDRVRPSHQAADGQVRRTGSRFRIGDSRMRYPGDPDGADGERFGCRCIIRPVLEE